MFLIVGLGNPGRQYEHTRHNAGFDVMDALAEKYNISISESGHKALFGKGMIGGQKVILAKPQTFKRIKVGVGEKPAGWDLADHVLGRMSEEDRAAFEEAVKESVKAVEMILEDEIDQAMNDFNRKKRESQS